MSLTNGLELERKILSKAIVKGGVGPIDNSLSRQGVFSPTGSNQRIDIPGSVLMSDVGFFAQPNPFGDRSTVRYSNKLYKDRENAFPLPTYYQNVIVNDANSPIVNQGQLFHTEQATVQQMMVEEAVVKAAPRLATTQIFPDLVQNDYSFL